MRPLAWAAALVALGGVLASCSNASSRGPAQPSAAPGVTATSITVGSIADITGPDSADFAPISKGVEAYFDMVNAQGGVDGRKLLLPASDVMDDQGNPSNDLAVAEELVQQKHVFAVVGVATPFFQAGQQYLGPQGVPTFGYVVSQDWDNYPNLFGTFGSYLDFSTDGPQFAYVARRLGATVAGIVAYGVPQSADACQAGANALPRFGIQVGFVDLHFQYGGDPTPDVLAMRQHHVDFFLSCLDVSGNVNFARAFSQNGMSGIHQLWLNGYDRSTLNEYGSLMQGVVFLVQHVPFEAASLFPGKYPGMALYLKEMQRYEPAYTYDEVALNGWIAAAQFVAGLRAVHGPLTRAALVHAINQETDFTAGGLMTPLDWKAGHNTVTPPFCTAFVQVKGRTFVLAFVQPGDEVYVCLDANGKVTSPPPGTPGT
jgi:branched-chain amino acid transport system substrate-binding protein